MREATTQRDQREIVVPRDMRPGNLRPGKTTDKTTAKTAPRRAAGARAAGSASSEFLATMAAFGAWIVRVCTSRPGEALGSVAALVAVAYVSVNALGRQDGRHPAPILPQPVAQHAKAEPAPAKTSAKPPAAAMTATPAPAEPAPKDRAEPRHAEKAPARDAIGEILRSAGDTTASVTPKPLDKVAQAQRALSKLGYGTIKADGVMGPATKAALEKFERDRKLPVTGEAAGRTLRELAAKSGAAKG